MQILVESTVLFDSDFPARFYVGAKRLPGAPMDITNRDRFIIGKALLYAIKYVDNLPEHVREHSERNRNSVLETGKPIDIGIAKHYAIPDDLRNAPPRSPRRQG